METKNFKSFTGEDIRVAMTSGHVFLISTGEWTSIPKFAWRDSYSAGAVSEDTVQAAAIDKTTMDIVKTKTKVEDRKLMAKEIVKGWIEENDLEKFSTKDGKPKSTEIGKILKCQFPNGQRDEIWYQLQEEMK